MIHKKVKSTMLLGFLALSACKTTTPVPSHHYHFFQDYLKEQDYKAFATSLQSWSGAGTAYNYSSVNAAIDAAIQQCEQVHIGDSDLGECKLRYLGDEFVFYMDSDELQGVIERYQKNNDR